MKSSIKKVKKDWGYELWLVNNKEENYCGKILYINEGCAGSMHFHANKQHHQSHTMHLLSIKKIETPHFGFCQLCPTYALHKIVNVTSDRVFYCLFSEFFFKISSLPRHIDSDITHC